jgi:serine carboxypeptidase-like clade 2
MSHIRPRLYIDSPVGVSFSYSKTNSDYTSSDDSTANDNYIAMKQFLLKFPEYTNRDLYLVGESFAGHYIPTLVTKMVSVHHKSFLFASQKHHQLDAPLPFNLRGFGNNLVL